jgi:hypothetical protein
MISFLRLMIVIMIVKIIPYFCIIIGQYGL